jgi:tetratricopeptide (TPR) repeat protein
MRFKFIAGFLLIATVVSCGKSQKYQAKNTADSTRHQVIGSPIPKELVELNKKISESPSDPKAYNNRAKYYIKTNDLDLAYNDIRYSFKLDTGYMETYNVYADYYLRKGDPAQAKLLLEHAIQMNDKSVMTYVKLGQLYFFAKKYDVAFEKINTGLKINKYYAEGYFWKGMIYKEKGDMANAISNFQTTVEQDPDYYDAYMQMGIISTEQKSKDAVDYFSSAIKVKPKSVEAWYGRGYYYQLNDEFDKAIQDYTQVIKIDSANASAHYNLGILHYDLRVIDLALTNFNNAIKYNPKYAEAYYMRGLCNESKSNDDAAIADFEYAMSLRPDYPLAQKGLERVKATQKILNK